MGNKNKYGKGRRKKEQKEWLEIKRKWMKDGNREK
jgi:hypothetical protein